MTKYNTQKPRINLRVTQADISKAIEAIKTPILHSMAKKCLVGQTLNRRFPDKPYLVGYALVCLNDTYYVLSDKVQKHIKNFMEHKYDLLKPFSFILK